jgi:hypothetical protein
MWTDDVIESFEVVDGKVTYTINHDEAEQPTNEMILRKRWITRKYNPKGFKNAIGNPKFRTRHWLGLFLFGFIPLWIDNTSTHYQ